MTLQAKSYILRRNVQDMKLSKTLDPGSTLSAKDLTPYWNELCLEMSKKLLLRTNTGCVGSDLICEKDSRNCTEQASWFATSLHSHQSRSLPETCFPSFSSSRVGYTDLENTLVRSQKIRIYPKSESLQLFKRFCGLSRYWFNQAVAYLQQDSTRAILSSLRHLQHDNLLPAWALDCPQRIREHALADAVDAVKLAKRKFKKTKQFQKVKFRCKRNPKQGFGFDLKSLKANELFSKKSWRVYFHASEDLGLILETAKEGTRIVSENDKWFVIIPCLINIKNPDIQRIDYVALDPGVRTFQSFYSNGMYGKIGEGGFLRIYKLCLHLDGLISKTYKTKGLKRLNMKKAIKRLRWKIKDLINDLHHKTAHFLCTNFETIFLPTFETSEMVNRTTRKIRTKTARSMLTFAHYRFKQFLKSKAEEYGSVVVDVCEAYTSKTCSYCGKIHNIGSKKILKCGGCGAVVDRDLNGARGIYLRSMSRTTDSLRATSFCCNYAANVTVEPAVNKQNSTEM